jgi:integrase
MPGLRLVIYPSNRRVWIWRHRRPDGRSGKLTLGPLDYSPESNGEPVLGGPLSLAAARRLASEAARQRAAGGDPAAAKQAAKQNPVSKTVSFAQVLPDYLAHLTKHNRSAKEMSDVLGGFASPTVWGSKPLDAITSQDCHELIERCRCKGLPGRKVLKPVPCESRARFAYSLLQGFFSWAVRQRKLERSPMYGLEAPSAAPERDRVLDDAEMRTFWKACESLSPWHCAALRLLLLTGQRLREISELRFAEIVDGLLVLSCERTKNKRPHRLPLSSLAQEIVASLPRVNGCPLVFSFGRVPVDGWAKIKRRLDAAMAAQGWNGLPFVIHDLRRTAATGLARQGTPIHVTEKILNHASGSLSGVAAIYNRYDYAQEMREALERWAETVRQLVGQDFGFSPAHGTQTTSDPLQRR